MANNVPERLINFRVYNDANALLGVATIDLPEISAMADTISGAGIAGEIESPTMGHYGSMTTTIKWRTVTPDAVSLMEHKAHALECRGSQQIYDAANGIYSTQAVRVSMRCLPKRVAPGTFQVANPTDSETEMEVTYIKVDINGVTKIEIDKFNFKTVVNGVNTLASVAADLGM